MNSFDDHSKPSFSRINSSFETQGHAFITYKCSCSTHKAEQAHNVQRKSNTYLTTSTNINPTKMSLSVGNVDVIKSPRIECCERLRVLLQDARFDWAMRGITSFAEVLQGEQ